MSKTQDKRKQRKIEHAEFMWKQAQLKDALGELTEDQIKQTEDKAKEQYQRIEEYLMTEKEMYLERLGIQQD